MLKVGIISCGMIARSAHIPAYLYHKDDFEVVAVCDINAEAARSTAAEFGIPKYYTDAEDMLRDNKLDIVSVCSGNGTHKALVMTALGYRVNVLCEKPLAICRRDAVEMFAYAKKQGVKLMACQTLRYMPERKAAHALIQSGEIGKIYSCEFSRIRSRGIPHWGKFCIKKYSGGGAFLDIGCHSIDSALWFLGDPEPLAVTAVMHKVHTEELCDLKKAGAFTGNASGDGFDPADMDVESFSSGCVTFKNGVMLLFKAAWAANLQDENNIVLAGEKGGFNTEKREIYKDGKTFPLDVKTCVFDESPFFGHFQIVKDFARALCDGQELPVKPSETIHTAAILEAGYLSAKEGRTVQISELDG